MGRILVVEDEIKMTAFIKQGLSEHGHEVQVAHTAYEALKKITDEAYELLLVDIMLPDMDGKQLTKKIREGGYHGSIMMLTALGTTQDKISGLDAGADDYLTKPFEFDELLARVRALTRRNPESSTLLKNGELEMDLIKRCVLRSGQLIELTTREFSLLELFMRHIGQTIDRNTIAREVWGHEFDSESNVIDVYVNHLRKKIDKDFEKKLIKTVVGHGYTLLKA
jgi:two-component system, OmpR family, copper resistance phosphate regulon response regulator CusR